MADAQNTSTGTFVFGLAVAAIGGVVAGWIGHDVMTPAPAQPPLSSMLSEPAAATVAPPNAAAVAAAESALVQQYEQINLGFVAQLRKYGTRLTEIADVAEAEGAATASEQMREFAQETDDIVARFDKVSKQ